MKVLIVYAHPEPKSFNGAMRDLAVSVLEGKGHTVQVSDLYAMKFKAVPDQKDFIKLGNPDYFKLGLEQQYAQKHDIYTEDIKTEQQKLLWANFVLFQFPVNWFSMPALLKGWVDRIFGLGFVYGGGKWYDTGGLKGRKAMLSMTTGGPASFYGSRGRNGDMELLLWPIQNGILKFAGFDVLPPFVAWGVAHVSEEQRKKYLEEFRQRLLTLDSTPPLFFHPSGDYDENFVLRKGIEPGTRFQSIQ